MYCGVSGSLNDKQQRQKKILSLRALPKVMRTQSYDYGKCTYPKNGNVKSILGSLKNKKRVGNVLLTLHPCKNFSIFRKIKSHLRNLYFHHSVENFVFFQ